MGRRQPTIATSGKLGGVVGGAVALACVLALAGSSGVTQAYADATDGTITSQSCYYADAGSGPDASGLCWLDWTGYDIPMLDDMTQASLDAAPAQQFSASIPGGYTMTYTVKYTPIYDGYPGNQATGGTVGPHTVYQLGDTFNQGVEPKALPTWVNTAGAATTASSKGSAFGASQYTGIAGMPALWAPTPTLGADWPIKDKLGNPSSAGGDVLTDFNGDPTAVVGLLPATGWTVTLSDITMTDAAGKPVTGWALTAADAESTNQGESLTFASDSASPWQITNWMPPRYYTGLAPDYNGTSPAALFSSINLDACGGVDGWAPKALDQHTYGNNFTSQDLYAANPGQTVWGGVTSGASGSTQWLTCTGVSGNTGALMASTVSPTSVSVTAYEELENGAMGELSGEQAFALAINTSQVTLTKDVAGRAAPSDQFGLTIADQIGTTLASATTNGTDTSATTVPATVLADTSYTLSESGEAGASLSNYSQSWSCSNSTTAWDTSSANTALTTPNVDQAVAVNASVSGGTLPIGTLPSTQMPDGAAGASQVATPVTGDSIACTLTNTPLPPRPTDTKTPDIPPSDPTVAPASGPSIASNTGGSVVTAAGAGAAGLLVISGLALAVVRFGRKRA